MIVIVIIDISEVCHYIIYWFNSVETFWSVLKGVNIFCLLNCGVVQEAADHVHCSTAAFFITDFFSSVY